MDLTGQAKDVKQKLEMAHLVNAQLNFQLVGAGFMEAQAQVQGPRTKEGLKRLADSKTIHGRFTKSERAKAKSRAEQGRLIRRELKELEAWFIDHGHLKKNWRKDLDIFFQTTSLR